MLGPLIAPMAWAAGGDSFASPTPVDFDQLEAADLAGATSEDSEPTGFSNTLGWTRWWLVRAPGRGRLVVEIDRSSDCQPAMVGFRRSGVESPVFTGGNSLVEPCPNRFAARRHWDFAMDAEAGDELLLGADVAFDGLIPTRMGPNGPELDFTGPTCFQFRVRFHAAPANDRFQEPQILPPGFSSLEANLLAASVEPGEARIDGSLGRTVWYEWTAPANGRLSLGPTGRRSHVPAASSPGLVPWSGTEPLTSLWGLLESPFWLPVGYAGGGILGSSGVMITTSGGGGGIVTPPLVDCTPIPSSLTVPVVPSVGIYTGPSLDALVPLARGLEVACPVTGGATYRISMDATVGELGLARLSAAFTAVPENDDIEQAKPVAGNTLDLRGHSVGATRQVLDAESAGSVWWSWSADTEGPVQLSARSADAANVHLEVRAAGADGSPRSVGSGPNTLSFYAAKGVRYWIGISPVEAQGDYEASIRQLPSKLRPVVIHSANPISGLIVGETGWKRALLQQALNGLWMDLGIVVPGETNPGGAVAGYLIPLAVSNLDPSSSGLFRLWFLDFDLPATALSLIHPPVAPDPLHATRLELKTSPGRWFRIESSVNLTDWTSTSVVLRSAGVSQMLVPGDATAELQFYRAQESVVTALPLRFGN